MRSVLDHARNCASRVGLDVDGDLHPGAAGVAAVREEAAGGVALRAGGEDVDGLRRKAGGLELQALGVADVDVRSGAGAVDDDDGSSEGGDNGGGCDGEGGSGLASSSCDTDKLIRSLTPAKSSAPTVGPFASRRSSGRVLSAIQQPTHEHPPGQRMARRGRRVYSISGVGLAD